MNTAYVPPRTIPCPVNLTPNCLDVYVGGRGTEYAGKLVLGLKLGEGLKCSDTGVTVDECFVKQSQYRFREQTVFSTGLVYTTGLV
jgi:hypothetical protein